MNHGWETLADGVYRCRLPFLDVTVGLVRGTRSTLLIDCGTTLSEASGIGEDVRALTGSAVDHLVMTHYHFDHVLGCGGFPGARIHAAPAVSDALGSRIEETGDDAVRHGADPAEVAEAMRRARRPDHPVARSSQIDLGGPVVTVEHPGRGHTDHDLIVVVPGDPAVVFCGDLVEESAEPAIDDGSDLRAWPATLDRVLRAGRQDGIYVPGHGAVVDAAFVRAQRDWLAARP
ncbi:MAG: MBL fold metallo-hydrolase [Mycobacterium sp.]|nr:MBL fold metallo-hydrolase [Mycobacterium sp.]